MSPAPRVSQRREQAVATRELLLRTAERLYAERGISAVSNRHVAEAAGSANNSAVGYYVGTKADLVAAISRSHSGPIGRQMRQMVEAARGSLDPRDHVACLVRSYTEHLASLGNPSWFARMNAQTTTDPTLGEATVFEESLEPALREAFEAMWALGPRPDPDVLALRQQMVRVMVIHTCAEQERVAAVTGTPADWAAVGDGLIEAVTSVMTRRVGDPPARPARPGYIREDASRQTLST